MGRICFYYACFSLHAHVLLIPTHSDWMLLPTGGVADEVRLFGLYVQLAETEMEREGDESYACFVLQKVAI